jgi:hypothetical protein
MIQNCARVARLYLTIPTSSPLVQILALYRLLDLHASLYRWKIPLVMVWATSAEIRALLSLELRQLAALTSCERC